MHIFDISRRASSTSPFRRTSPPKQRIFITATPAPCHVPSGICLNYFPSLCDGRTSGSPFHLPIVNFCTCHFLFLYVVLLVPLCFCVQCATVEVMLGTSFRYVITMVSIPEYRCLLVVYRGRSGLRECGGGKFLQRESPFWGEFRICYLGRFGTE